MYKIVYLPTGELIPFPKDCNWDHDEQFCKYFLRVNEAYQDFKNPDRIFFLTYDQIVMMENAPGKRLPKHLLEVIEVT